MNKQQEEQAILIADMLVDPPEGQRKGEFASQGWQPNHRLEEQPQTEAILAELLNATARVRYQADFSSIEEYRWTEIVTIAGRALSVLEGSNRLEEQYGWQSTTPDNAAAACSWRIVLVDPSITVGIEA